MAQVTVTIDGKAYRMACEEGQESHLMDLAVRFDGYVGHLKGQFGEIGDLRLTVMAGIMAMDELSDLGRRMKALETEMESLRGSRETMVAAASESEEAVAAALTMLSQRIRLVADRLNGKSAPADPA